MFDNEPQWEPTENIYMLGNHAVAVFADRGIAISSDVLRPTFRKGHRYVQQGTTTRGMNGGKETLCVFRDVTEGYRIEISEDDLFLIDRFLQPVGDNH